MRAIALVETGVAGSSKAPALFARAIQKTSATSTLGREKAGAEGGRQKSVPQVQTEGLYRDDTPRFDPFWDGPRLVPAFVAQLLGQMMPERRESMMLETAYGRADSPRKALLQI